MKQLLVKLMGHFFFEKIVNRETIAYIIAGLMTTLVNLVSYEGLYRLGLSNLTANFFAWFIAVTFAYVVSKWNVFRSKSASSKDEAKKVIKFFGARVVTLGVEQLGMYLLVELMGVYRWIIKGVLSVLVILLNYIFSKKFVFIKNNNDS